MLFDAWHPSGKLHRTPKAEPHPLSEVRFGVSSPAVVLAGVYLASRSDKELIFLFALAGHSYENKADHCKDACPDRQRRRVRTRERQWR